MSRDIPHPFPERCDPPSSGRWSLQIQPSSAGYVTRPAHPMHLGPEEPHFVSPPASATSNHARLADTGYSLHTTYRPHPRHPSISFSPIGPSSSVPMLPLCRPPVPFDAGYRAYDPPSIQHDMRHSSQLPNGLSRPCPFPELPYQGYHGPPAQARVLPSSSGLYMHQLCQSSPVPAVPAVSAVSAVRALASFQPRPPLYDSLRYHSSTSYSETEICRRPSSELDSISPPTSSDLPMTPPDHTTAPQLPFSSQLQSLNSPPPHYIPASTLHFSPALTGPAFPTGKDKPLADTQTPLKPKISLNEGTKDVFQSLKRKRLPVAATFSRPKPRTLPVKKILPKIHGCRTCGKMFDRPSTLLVHQASHTKAKDYACNKCRKTFSVNSNMRRHWRNCTDTSKDRSVPSSPSVPIKQEALSSPSEPSAPHFADSPLVPGPGPGPSGPLVTAFTAFAPRSLSVAPREQALTSGVSPTTTLTLPPKMAQQPLSIRGRFEVVSEPELPAVPVLPVQPRMTKAQEEEMKGWFLKAVWGNIMDSLRNWRLWRWRRRLCGASSPAAGQLAALLSPSDAATLVGEDFEEDGRDKKPWGEERDSSLNKGYAPYFGTQWNGVLPGPGPGDLPAVPTEEDEETAGEAAC